MKESSKEVELEFELPGFEKKDIKVKLGKNFASINAEKKTSCRVKKRDYFHEEKVYRSFKYSTTLPSVNPKKAKTEFKQGRLKIVAPKE